MFLVVLFAVIAVCIPTSRPAFFVFGNALVLLIAAYMGFMFFYDRSVLDSEAEFLIPMSVGCIVILACDYYAGMLCGWW